MSAEEVYRLLERLEELAQHYCRDEEDREGLCFREQGDEETSPSPRIMRNHGESYRHGFYNEMEMVVPRQDGTEMRIWAGEYWDGIRSCQITPSQWKYLNNALTQLKLAINGCEPLSDEQLEAIFQ